jgi:hypothetical protein
MVITTPAIARLFLRPRLWAFEHLQAGDFGPVICRRGRAYYVDLAAVEAFAGRSFTPVQLAAAGITQPHQEKVT